MAGVNLPPVAFGEVPSPPLGDNFGVQQLRAWFDEKKEEERVILKGSLILMELEEETGGEVGVVRKSLTRSYNPFDARTTCYNPLYQSDENGDAILQKTKYTKFITHLSEGAVDPENYLDFSFAFKVNFIYLSCQCKFHSNPSIHGGEECCLGPDAGIHIPGAGPLSDSIFDGDVESGRGGGEERADGATSDAPSKRCKIVHAPNTTVLDVISPAGKLGVQVTLNSGVYVSDIKDTSPAIGQILPGEHVQTALPRRGALFWVRT